MPFTIIARTLCKKPCGVDKQLYRSPPNDLLKWQAKKPACPTFIGIYISVCSFSLEGEGWDEADINS
jgi:hypothetical protein